jgi:hypothetical protein
MLGGWNFWASLTPCGLVFISSRMLPNNSIQLKNLDGLEFSTHINQYYKSWFFFALEIDCNVQLD